MLGKVSVCNNCTVIINNEGSLVMRYNGESDYSKRVFRSLQNLKDSTFNLVALSDNSMSAVSTKNEIYYYNFELSEDDDLDDLDGEGDEESPKFVEPPAKLENEIVSLDADKDRYIALDSSGVPYIWGDNRKDDLSYLEFSKGGYTSVAIGEKISCLVRKGKLKIWGDDGDKAFLKTDDDITKVFLHNRYIAFLNKKGVLTSKGKTIFFNTEDDEADDAKPIPKKKSTIEGVLDMFCSTHHLFLLKEKKGVKSIHEFPEGTKYKLPENYVKYACGDDYNAHIDTEGRLTMSYSDGDETVTYEFTKYSQYLKIVFKKLFDKEKYEEIFDLSMAVDPKYLNIVQKMFKDLKSEKQDKTEFVNNLRKDILTLDIQYDEYLSRANGYKTAFKRDIGSIFGLSGSIKDFPMFLKIAELLIQTFGTVRQELDEAKIKEDALNEIMIIPDDEDFEYDSDFGEDEKTVATAGEEDEEESSFVGGSDYGDKVKIIKEQYVILPTVEFRITNVIANVYQLSKEYENINRIEKIITSVNRRYVKSADEEEFFEDIIGFDNVFFVKTKSGKILTFSAGNLSTYL